MKLPLDERPRERLAAHGPAVLSSVELLAVLIGRGTQGVPVMTLAENLLIEFSGLDGIRNASLHELIQVKGLGRAGALALQAAFALSTRLAPPERPPITSAEQARDHLTGLSLAKTEQLVLLLRDVKGRLIRSELVSVGTLTEVLVHPREVLRPAIAHAAVSYIIAHNHPSGDPSPSTADLKLTQNLIKASALIGIPLDDHLIVTPDAFFSFYAEGYFSERKKY